jgi:hypothetical protein
MPKPVGLVSGRAGDPGQLRARNGGWRNMDPDGDRRGLLGGGGGTEKKEPDR